MPQSPRSKRWLTKHPVNLQTHCGGLTFAHHQVPTKLLSHSSFVNRTGAESKMEKLMGEDEDREITQQLPSLAKQT